MRTVYFRKNNNWGSGQMRGDQIAGVISTAGHDADTVTSVEGIKDSIIVFVKYAPLAEVQKAKANNNIIFYDFVDFLANSNEYKIAQTPEFAMLCNMFDGIIHTTQKSLDFMKDKVTCHMVVIPHHYDPRIIYPNIKTARKLSIGYIGMPHNLMFGEDIPELNKLFIQYDFTPFLDNTSVFSCHYTVRHDSSIEYAYKPATKVFTASACAANVITTRDENAIEFLPIDYPYLTNPDLESVKATVAKVKETFGSEIWNYGLSIMEEIRMKTNVYTIGKAYIELFSKI